MICHAPSLLVFARSFIYVSSVAARQPQRLSGSGSCPFRVLETAYRSCHNHFYSMLMELLDQSGVEFIVGDNRLYSGQRRDADGGELGELAVVGHEHALDADIKNRSIGHDLGKVIGA